MVPAESNAKRPRKRIGRYLVIARVGRGGMGMVYRGYDEALEREVAIKTLTVEGTLDEESRKRFEIEAKAAARLQHPNILTVFELGDERGVPFIAMELLPGVDLEELLRSGEELLLQEKLEIVIQVCRGLAYAHEHKIVHRDIKPSNVRLLDDGTIKIMDFGIAKLQGTGVTRSGMMVGTVHYMSPEQIRGQPLDGRSDVFSLGVILYEMLVGRRPFAGQGATEILYKIVHEDPAPLAAGAPPLPPRLQEIVARALAKNQQDRCASATQLAEELSAVLAEVSRAATVQVAAADVETLGTSRRLLKEGRVEECLRRLRELSDRQPGSLEARRALRAATREMQRRQLPAQPQEDEFPELEATFQSPPTRAASAVSYPLPPPTRIAPGAAVPAVDTARARPAPGGAALAVGAGIALAAALAAGLYLLRDGPSGSSETERPPAVRSQPPGPLVPERRAPEPVQLAVSSDPPGAAVALDGRELAGVTPVSVELNPSLAHRLSLSLDGYKIREVAIPAGEGARPLNVALEPSGPLGTVSVASSFPVDVIWKGRTLARGQTGARVSLPAGRHALTLVSSAYFLKSSVSVQVRAGAEAALRAPELGKISIRANPDNCQVLIDGVFVDYPPILDKPIAAGAHTVTFKWPDGRRADESAEVIPGRIEYVMGRRE